MILHALQILTSAFGWYALSYLLSTADPVIAALVGAGGVMHVLYQLKEYKIVFFMTPDMEALKSLMDEHRVNPNDLNKLTVERIKAIQTDGDNWEIEKFESVGNMYVSNDDIELILGLLKEAGEIKDGYNVDDYTLNKEKNVIYVMWAATGKPMFRLEFNDINK